MICGRSIGLGCDAGSRSVEAFASLVPLCSGPTVPMLVDTTAVSVAFLSMEEDHASQLPNRPSRGLPYLVERIPSRPLLDTFSHWQR